MVSSLSTYEQMKVHFTELCVESRQELRQRLLSKSTKDEPFEQELTQAFEILYTTMYHNNSSQALTKLKELFGIDNNLLEEMNERERKKYITECILRQSINESLEDIGTKKSSSNIKSKTGTHKQFSWLGLNTKYEYLKPMFQQILLKKIRWFDQQLSESLTFFNHDTQQHLDQDETKPNFMNSTPNSTMRCHSSACTTKYCKISNRKITMTKDKSQNVAIRNESKFLKTQWTRADEDEFMDKKKELISRFKKGSKIPIIYQFVKKYTETNKRRDLLLEKWGKNEHLTEEQLGYLCATSVFLNQSINRSEKHFIGQKLDGLKKDMISEIQFNIAEKIIDTYKEFMGKVSGIRSNYYLKVSQKTKRNLEEKEKQALKEYTNKTKYQDLMSYKKMFTNICNSKFMKWKFNYKVSRWVFFFIDKLKQRCRIKRSRGKSSVVRRLTASKSQREVDLRKKVENRSTKFFKPVLSKRKIKLEDSYLEDNPQNLPKTRKSLKSANKSQSLSKFRLLYNCSPLLHSKQKQTLQPFSHYITYPSSIVPSVIKIQSLWRMFSLRRAFKAKVVVYRQQKSIEMQKQVEKLRLIYPLYTKINYLEVLKRINRTDMIRQFINLTKTKLIDKIKHKAEHIYLYFSQQYKSQQELQTSYKLQTNMKKKHNFERFIHYCHYNMVDKLMHSNMIFKGVDFNDLLDGKTALCCCVKNKNHRLINMLVSAGANPNLPDMSKMTPLHYAFKVGDINTVFSLLDHKGDLNSTDSNNHTPLFYASESFLKELGLENGTVTNNFSHRQSFIGDNNKLYRKSHEKKDDIDEMWRLQNI